MRIAMVGSGYVGLVSGACFAEFGHDVTCIDSDPSKIELLRSGGVPIFEPGLGELIAKNVVAERLRFTQDMAAAVSAADVVFIAVGTPARRGDGHADLRFVYAAAREIVKHARPGTVIVTKSTVPVGTGDEIERIAADERRVNDIGVVSNPEFLKEGAAIDDFMDPDRIVIGAQDDLSVVAMRKLYEPLTDKGAPLLIMDRRGAELTKYAANALLATKITFINEIANLCEAVGTDVAHISRGIGLDARIGSRFLAAGPGYGGSCFPKDTLALIKTAFDYGAPQRVVEAVVAANDQRKRAMGWKIVTALGEPRGKLVAVLGLTFKANTDDMRDSPAVAVIGALRDAGISVRAYDPQGMEHARAALDDVEFAQSAYAAIEGADAVVIATEWDEFANLDLERVRTTMRGKLLVDLRNVFTIDALDEAGFDHIGVGRRRRTPSADKVVRFPNAHDAHREGDAHRDAATA